MVIMMMTMMHKNDIDHDDDHDKNTIRPISTMIVMITTAPIKTIMPSSSS